VHVFELSDAQHAKCVHIQVQGFVARSAFKLKEIQQRFKVIKQGMPSSVVCTVESVRTELHGKCKSIGCLTQVAMHVRKTCMETATACVA
jgi:hypothetical protein